MIDRDRSEVRSPGAVALGFSRMILNIVLAAIYTLVHLVLFSLIHALAICAPLVVGALLMSAMNSLLGKVPASGVFLLGGLLASGATLVGTVRMIRIGLDTDLAGLPNPPKEIVMLARQVSDKVGVSHFHDIRITQGAECATLYAGRKRVLMIGLLLIKYLTRNELAAVIAHECGHHHYGSMLPNRIHYRAFMFVLGFSTMLVSRIEIMRGKEDDAIGGAMGLALLPQVVLLHGYVHLMRALGTALRQPDYEFYCDHVAAATFGESNLASALRKVTDLTIVLDRTDTALSSVKGRSWLLVIHNKYRRLQEGYDDGARYALDESATNTHPSLKSRIGRLKNCAFKASVTEKDDATTVLSEATVDDLWASSFLHQ